MGRYNLGKSTTEIQNKIVKDKLSINETKAKPLVNDINKQLDNISDSLHKINNTLNRSVSIGLIKGSKGNSFKSWAKKSKAQADNALKLKGRLNESFDSDIREYPIKLLDQRIAELEKKIESMNN